MRLLTLFLKIVLFVLLLGFAAKNSETVDVRYFMGLEWRLPLSLVMLIVFAVGLMIGLLSCSRRLFRQRRRLHHLTAELKKAAPADNPER